MEGGDVSNFVTLAPNQLVGELYYGNLTTYYHILVARVADARLYCMLQFFLGSDYLPPVYIINLGWNPYSIHYDESVAHAFEYYPSSKKDNYDGRMIKMIPVRMGLLNR